MQTHNTADIIKRAMRDRASLIGTYAQYRVHFAPKTLGRDAKGRLALVAFGGAVFEGGSDWMCFVVDRLRGLDRSPTGVGGVVGRPPFHLKDIEASVDGLGTTGYTG